MEPESQEVSSTPLWCVLLVAERFFQGHKPPEVNLLCNNTTAANISYACENCYVKNFMKVLKKLIREYK